MRTPAGPERGDPLAQLYGEACRTINRRALLGGAVALAGIGSAASAVPQTRTLTWRGRAVLDEGTRRLELVSETSLSVPLLRVRSTSWIVEHGPGAARTMILEPDGAWVERNGQRAPLDPTIAIHERQQYAIYAWLLLVQQGARRRPGRLPLSAPPWPDIVFDVGPDGYPTAADLTVDSPERGKPPVAEHIAFSGRLDSRGVRWPRRFDLSQGGRPYFSLTLEWFEAHA